ncbi:ribosome small subunit-dependent GTPase A [Shewanella intestini]|uniref:Small ribosomal subunit biogenesis GTPase RsgA n=1 Tax=Shewanella intestini TaxID=2017544 RepID=A0ABS5I699_9GAMM|nr:MULTISPECIES: ribosome small subunit-dependent GTPase A [Shewanella]MBR9729537.1 ribosome small subunit-dependent GTPase A [Shewanella intestini]MRG37522.1 ribosome small subunit-dependent GTPase A [Shewanella sp. XMDDZSB0408]
MSKTYSLTELGWRPFFQQQLTLAEWESGTLARVVTQHRNQLHLLSDSGELILSINANMPNICVGDWLLIDSQHRFVRLLERFTEFGRKASGSKLDLQLIAANLDTVFIVMSLNQDFKLSRLERYLTLVNETGAQAVVVLTKADLCDDPLSLQAEVQQLDPLLNVVSINALDNDCVSQLQCWCQVGKTLAVMGSSGVGKSTLLNTLQNQPLLNTGGIREDDSKGRHTTTARSLHVMDNGGLLMDTPGMRELQLTDVESGLSATFADIEALAQCCRFGDCSHHGEPGCAIEQALNRGELDHRRFNNYLKLGREQALNTASLAQRRAQDKTMSKMYRSVQGESRRRKKGL